MPRHTTAAFFKQFSRVRETGTDASETKGGDTRRHTAGSSVLTSWRRRPSIGSVDLPDANGRRHTTSPTFFSSGRGSSGKIARAFRKAAPVVGASPKMAARRFSWLSPKGSIFPMSPSARRSPKSPSGLLGRSPKSPKKYRRRMSSADLDKELEEMLDQDFDHFDHDDIPGILRAKDDFNELADWRETASSSFSLTFGSSRAPRRHSSLYLDKENYRTAEDPDLVMLREAEEQARLSEKTLKAHWQLEQAKSIANPCSFSKNQARVNEKMDHLKALQQRLALSEINE